MTARSAVAAGIAAPRSTTAGDGLLHPLAIGAVAVLLLNDHVLKAVAPGLLTGKASDFAGLIFFPLLLVAAFELIAAAAGRRSRPGAAAVGVAVVATAAAFTAVKLLAPGESAYEAALGLVQWPFAALRDLVAGLPVPAPRRVDLVRDPTDLVALAALWLPWLIGMARARAAFESPARAPLAPRCETGDPSSCEARCHD